MCLGFTTVNVYALNIDRVKFYFLGQDYKSAIMEGEKALAAAPQDSEGLDELYYILGLSYLKDGNYLRASDIFEIIIDEFKDTTLREEAEIGLADAYFLREDYDKARDYYRNIIDANSNSKFRAQVYYRLAQLSFKKGNPDEGKEYMDKMKDYFPLSPELKADNVCLFEDYSLGYYSIQVGSFASSRNADNLCDKLRDKGYLPFIEEANYKGKRFYRVKVGKLRSRAEAVQLEEKLSLEGYPTKICP